MKANTDLVENRIDVRHAVCADETFVSEFAQTRRGFLFPADLQDQITRPLSVHGVVGAYMAGMHCPDGDRLTQLMHDPADMEEWEKYAIRELFEQMSPVECREFMITTDGSPREFARLLRLAKVDRGIVVNWINQYSSDPNWVPDKELMFAYGERWSKQHNDRLRAEKEWQAKNLNARGELNKKNEITGIEES